MSDAIATSSHDSSFEENSTSIVEYVVLLTMLVSGVFLAGEIFDQTTNMLTVETASDPSTTRYINLTEDVTVEKTVNQWLPLAQVSVAGMFVTVATAFVARNLLRRRGQAKNNETHSLISIPNESEKENMLYVKRQELFRNLAGENFVESLQNFKIDRLMTTHVTTVGPRTPTSQVRRLMTNKHIHHVIVCSLDNTVLGVISDRDLLAKHGDSAQEVMTANPVCVTSDAAVLPTVTIMLERRISCLPVVQDEKLVGMVTTTDLLLSLQCLLQVLHIKLTPTQTNEPAHA